MKQFIATIFLLTTIAGMAFAQEIKISGQFRERSELDTKSFFIGQSTDAFHLLRARLRADAKVNEQVNVIFEIQDARQYGVPSSTMNVGSPDLDLRQGFVEVKNLCDLPVSVKLGRQLLAYGDERILGAIDWSNQGQSFDAALARIGNDELSADIFGAAVARNSNPYSGYIRDQFLTGIWAKWLPKDVRATVQGYYLYDNPAFDSRRRQQRSTAGVYAGGHIMGFDFELDGAYQFGTIDGTTLHAERKINANLVGIRIGYLFKELANLRIGVGFDRLSGSDPKSSDTTYGAFNTLYATNHKYYGFMDYFTNIPTQTTFMGLQDFIVQISGEPVSALKLAADLHIFSAVIDPAPIVQNPSMKKDIGMEIDVTLSMKVATAVNVTLGYSVFDRNKDSFTFPGDSSLTLGSVRKTTNWAYIMSTVNF